MDGFGKQVKRTAGGVARSLAQGVGDEVGQFVWEAGQQMSGPSAGQNNPISEGDGMQDQEQEEQRGRDLGRVRELEREIAEIRERKEREWKQKEVVEEQGGVETKKEDEYGGVSLPASPSRGQRFSVPGRKKGSDMRRVETRKPASG